MSYIKKILGDDGAWTIEVTVNGDPVGSPKTKYFVNENVVREKSNMMVLHRVDGHSRTIRLSLHVDAALAVPKLLCFLSSGTLELSTENACVMHHLAEYLDVPLLCATVADFCKTDLTMESAEMYYEKATMFGSGTILAILAKYLARNILQISEDSWSVTGTDLQLWLNILEPDRIVNSHHLSKLVAAVCTVHHQLPLDADSFYEMTDVAKLPLIDPDAAIPLAAFNEAFLRNGGAQNEAGHPYVSLKNRCIQALSSDWKEMEQRVEEMGAYGVLTDDFRLEVSMACLAQGKGDWEQAREEVEWFKEDAMTEWKANRKLNERLHETEEAKKVLVGELIQSRREKQKLALKKAFIDFAQVALAVVAFVMVRRNKNK